MANDTVVFEVPPGQFDSQVIQASSERAIVVDFWAEWCGPCRVLTPVLEGAVRSFGGRAALAKVNIDQHREVAAQYGIQSIPAVKVFVGGQVATEFIGALPEAQVKRILASVIPSAVDEMVAEGDALAKQGDLQAAAQRYRGALEQDAHHGGALLRLGTLALESGQIDEAQETLSRIEENAAEHDAAQGLLGRIGFIATCKEHGSLPGAEARVGENPDDLDARYGLGCCLAAEGQYERALEEFLKVTAADKNFSDGAARNAMLHIFSIVGPRSDLANAYRKKLAAVLY